MTVSSDCHYTVVQKNKTPNYCPYLCQIFAHFRLSCGGNLPVSVPVKELLKPVSLVSCFFGSRCRSATLANRRISGSWTSWQENWKLYSHTYLHVHGLHFPTCTGWPKNCTIFVRLKTLPNINRFSKLFHCQKQEKICSNIITRNSTHLKCVPYTTLPCEMSVSYKKLSYCWETVRRESMPNIAEKNAEMTT